MLFFHNKKQYTSKIAHLFLVSCQRIRQWQWGLAGLTQDSCSQQLAATETCTEVEMLQRCTLFGIFKSTFKSTLASIFGYIKKGSIAHMIRKTVCFLYKVSKITQQNLIVKFPFAFERCCSTAEQIPFSKSSKEKLEFSNYSF